MCTRVMEYSNVPVSPQALMASGKNNEEVRSYYH